MAEEPGRLKMQKQLNAMKKEMTMHMRENASLRKAIKEISINDLIKASLLPRAMNYEDVNIDGLLDGHLQKNIPIKDYVFIENMKEVAHLAMNCLELSNYLDRNLLLSSYRILAEDKTAYFRKNNPVVYDFNHVPPHSFDIDERLDVALKKIYQPELGDDVVLKAMYIHNKIIEIYPFKEYNAELAIFAMNYFLMENGFMPIEFPLKRYPYCELTAACIKGRKQEEMYNHLVEAVYTKMADTIIACRNYGEKE